MRKRGTHVGTTDHVHSSSECSVTFIRDQRSTRLMNSNQGAGACRVNDYGGPRKVKAVRDATAEKSPERSRAVVDVELLAHSIDIVARGSSDIAPKSLSSKILSRVTNASSVLQSVERAL